jgi:hypothetical protein
MGGRGDVERIETAASWQDANPLPLCFVQRCECMVLSSSVFGFEIRRSRLDRLCGKSESRNVGTGDVPSKPGVAADGEGDGEADTEDVYDYADEHHFDREGIFSGGGERYDDAIHEKVDGHAI